MQWLRVPALRRGATSAAEAAVRPRHMSTFGWGGGRHDGDHGGGDRGACRGGSAVDWLFAAVHSSRAMRALVGGRFGHRYWCSGWGDPALVAHLSAVQARRFGDVSCGSLYRDAAAEVAHAISWTPVSADRDGVSVWEGEFLSPVQDGSLPVESLRARFQLVLPAGLPAPNSGRLAAAASAAHTPALIHLAGLGDYTFVMRRVMMYALAREHGVASLILQSPFYGDRKPRWQRGAKLEHVADLLSLGNATIEESLLLIQWLREMCFGPIGVCGFSMGGVHSMMVAAVEKTEQLALISFLAPHSAGAVFCRGPLSHACDWQVLAQSGDGVRRDGCGGGGWRGGGGTSGLGRSACAEEEEVVRQRLDEVLAITDIRRLPAPKCPSATVLVQASQDAYVQAASERRLRESWHARWRRTPPSTPPPSASTAREGSGGGGGGGGVGVGGGERGWWGKVGVTGGGRVDRDEFGVETAWVRGGHVTSFFSEHALFREKMLSALSRLPNSAHARV